MTSSCFYSNDQRPHQILMSKIIIRELSLQMRAYNLSFKIFLFLIGMEQGISTKELLQMIYQNQKVITENQNDIKLLREDSKKYQNDIKLLREDSQKYQNKLDEYILENKKIIENQEKMIKNQHKSFEQSQQRSQKPFLKWVWQAVFLVVIFFICYTQIADTTTKITIIIIISGLKWERELM